MLLGSAGMLAILAGTALLATRDPLDFFDTRTVGGIVLCLAGSIVSFVFRPRSRERIGRPVSWTGPAAVIGLLLLAGAAVALLVLPSLNR
jgi:drug/metabolite transporter (DMT)-like permease